MRILRAVLVVLAVGFMFDNVALAEDPFAVREDAIAESGSFGIGFGHAGAVSGLSGKLLLGETQALQGVVGWGPWLGLAGALDYTIELGSLADVEIFRLNYYAGAGAMLGLGNWSGSMSLGINAVLGLSFRLRALPLELTAEFRPTFVLGGWSSHWTFPLKWWGGSAIRWYF